MTSFGLLDENDHLLSFHAPNAKFAQCRDGASERSVCCEEPSRRHFFFGFGDAFFGVQGVCARALAAADFECLDVRPSVSVLDAAVAAFLLVCRFGVPVWESAEPDAVLDFAPVAFDASVLEALDAAFFPVVFLFVVIPATV